VAAALGRPAPILEFDLDTLADAEALPSDFTIERTATADMIVDGTCIWFEALFDDDTVLSTSPLGPLTSWGNRLYRLDQTFAEGETLRIDLHLGRLTDPDTWLVLHH
jgi:protein arginine N-methyltransferase 1